MNKTAITLNKALEYQVQKSAEKTFIIHRSDSYTYGQTHDLVNRFAAYLLAAGIRQGDPVCLMLPRSPELIIAFLAATKIGACPAPINYLLRAEEIVVFIQGISSNILVSNAKILSPELENGLSTIDMRLIDTDNSINGWESWRTAVAGLAHEEESAILPENLAYSNFTTGSSGRPKEALATHSNIYWNTRAAVESFNMNADDIHLCMFAPFAHPHELFARALYTGASLVLIEGINPKTIIHTINRHSITCMMGLAPLYEIMAVRCGTMSIPSLRVAESGGMYTRQSVNQKFLKQFGLPILSVWGSTETSGIALANTNTEYRTDGSMGKVCPHYQVKLINENNTEVTGGEVGELFFKGPGIVAGYRGHGSITDDDGWFASGDMARKDDNDFYYFVDRKSGMVKVAGLKVYPLQVELVLLEHPDIAEVAILGIPDKRKGDVPKAFVVLKDGMYLDSDEIETFCKGRLPHYLVPKQIEIRENLPKIGSGKINKKALALSISPK